MEKAKAFQIVIQETEKAIENEKFMDGPIECESYLESEYEYVKKKKYLAMVGKSNRREGK